MKRFFVVLALMAPFLVSGCDSSQTMRESVSAPREKAKAAAAVADAHTAAVNDALKADDEGDD